MKYMVIVKTGYLIEADDEDEAEDIFREDGGDVSYEYVVRVEPADEVEES